MFFHSMVEALVFNFELQEIQVQESEPNQLEQQLELELEFA